jgi:hypothetical protein
MIDCYDWGRQRFEWWPDWRGQTAVLVASGHSAKEHDLGIIGRRARVGVVGANIELYPDADVVYACDENWWMHVRGLPNFSGLKITQARNVCSRYPDVKRVEAIQGAMLLTKPGRVSSAGNSGFQLYNLVMQFGATKIVLAGYDMGSSGTPHWYGKNKWEGASNPKEVNFARWRAWMDGTAQQAISLGVRVINVGSCSTLTAFPKMSLEDALAA